MTHSLHIYRVFLKKAIRDKKDYYFTSLSAIYDTFTVEQIGCGVNRLWNLKITQEKPYIGKKCTISKELIVRKKQINLKKMNNDTD